MLKIIQYIAFFGLAIVSTGLGIILYTGLSHDLLSFAIMLIVAGVIEAVKILCLTWYNTVMWQSNQIKNLHIDDINSYRKFLFLSIKAIPYEYRILGN